MTLLTVQISWMKRQFIWYVNFGVSRGKTFTDTCGIAYKKCMWYNQFYQILWCGMAVENLNNSRSHVAINWRVTCASPVWQRRWQKHWAEWKMNVLQAWQKLEAGTDRPALARGRMVHVPLDDLTTPGVKGRPSKAWQSHASGKVQLFRCLASCRSICDLKADEKTDHSDGGEFKQLKLVGACSSIGQTGSLLFNVMTS